MRPDRATERRIESLERDNEILRARVEALSKALTAGFALPLEWRLTPLQRRILVILARSEVATREAVFAGAWELRPEADYAGATTIYVRICHIRAKLKPFGVKIHTLRGCGWSLDAATRARLQKLNADPAQTPPQVGTRHKGTTGCS